MNRLVYKSADEFLRQNTEAQTDLPFSESTQVLANSICVGNKTVPNRLVCQAMEGCDGTAEGAPDTLTARRYERFAKGGAGLIWFEATAVMKEGRANPRQLFIHQETMDAFRRQVEAIKETALRENGYEPLVIMQATHSGRYSKPNGIPEPLIAYNNPIFEKDNPISADRIVTDEYLDRVGEALVEGARMAEAVGFDGVDIKCCHRYLNSELLSAYTREGRYGGSFENRTRLLRESIAGARAVCSSDFIVSSRLNVYDGFPYPYGFGVSQDGGIEPDLSEPIRLITELYEAGVRLLNITMGNPYFNPHVNRPFSKGAYEAEEHPLAGVARMLGGTAKIKAAVPEMSLICSGLSYLGAAAPNVAAAFVQDGAFDLCGFGRQIFAYPDFAKDILQEGALKKDKLCLCCSKCTELMRAGSTPGCVIRDPLYAELYREHMKKKS